MAKKNMNELSPYTKKLTEGLNSKFVEEPHPTSAKNLPVSYFYSASIDDSETGYDKISRVLNGVGVILYCLVDRVTGDVLATKGKKILYNVATEEGYQELLNSKKVLVTELR